jgi:predicted RNA-binding protein with PUA-like domain
MGRMAGRWLVKSDPETYSFEDLRRDRKTVWDGVANPVALKHLRAMRRGDEVLVYHTGKERAVVGRARVESDPYTDPSAGASGPAVVDLAAGEPLPRPVSLAEIKADPFFAELALVRQGRLSVMPVPEPLWERIGELAAKTP